MRGEPPQVPEPLRRLRRSQYERLVDAGAFDEDDHIELLDGFIYEMSPIGGPHARVTARVAKRLILALGDDWEVLSQSSFAATEWSMPEPDVAVVAHGLAR